MVKSEMRGQCEAGSSSGHFWRGGFVQDVGCTTDVGPDATRRTVMARAGIAMLEQCEPDSSSDNSTGAGWYMMLVAPSMCKTLCVCIVLAPRMRKRNLFVYDLHHRFENVVFLWLLHHRCENVMCLYGFSTTDVKMLCMHHRCEN